MDEDVDVPQEMKQYVDEVLDPGKIDISHEIATFLPLSQVLERTHTHFRHTDLRYRKLSKDTFLLRARSRKYPLFGSFVGQVHVFEKLPARQPRDYKIEGLLEYRVSLLWLIAVLSFFFLLAYVLRLDFWFSVALEAFGTGLVIYTTHRLGRDERDEVEERVEASFLGLRATLQNLR
jgi:hypothetical protein